MATILMAHELGSGLGHVMRLLPLAEKFVEHGHEAVFAVPDIVTAAPVLRDGRYRVFQSPVWRTLPQRTGQRFPGARSFADILAVQGFAEPDGLLAMVEAWQGLIEAAGADLVVCDHSPTPCLAAYGAMPAAVVGNGFTVPPANVPEYPVFNPKMREYTSHRELVESIAKVQKARGRPAPETVPGIYGKARCFVCTLPELDPYAELRETPAIGPITVLPGPAPLPEEPRFFAYLHANERDMKYVLSSIADSGVKGAFYLAGGPLRLNEKLRELGFEVHESPPSLPEILPTVSVAIHHGGPGTAAAALACGRPQVLMPRHFEQTLYGRAMTRLGSAAVLPRRSSKLAGNLLRTVLSAAHFGERAQARAHKIAERGYDRTVAAIVEDCEALLG